MAHVRYATIKLNRYHTYSFTARQLKMFDVIAILTLISRRMTVCLVVERWLDSSTCSSANFEYGSMIMWWMWKNRYKWVFERFPFSAEATRITANSKIQCMNSARRNALVTLPTILLIKAGLRLPRTC